ncbi:hypothetical protein, partial [Priestia megaterium]|uniref:hypothetical protein n=1 Tax=Priestia megaterium TaxID=1404 RepID=UPI0035B5A79A
AARMPQLPKAQIKVRAAALRAAGEAALTRHLEAQVGRTVEALIERPGFARAPDFTEIVFEGEAVVGQIAPLRITGHAGGKALAVVPVLAAA